MNRRGLFDSICLVTLILANCSIFAPLNRARAGEIS
jgi:hypothetical protein